METCPPLNLSHEKDSKALILWGLDSCLESLSTHYRLDISNSTLLGLENFYILIHLFVLGSVVFNLKPTEAKPIKDSCHT